MDSGYKNAQHVNSLRPVRCPSRCTTCPSRSRLASLKPHEEDIKRATEQDLFNSNKIRSRRATNLARTEYSNNSSSNINNKSNNYHKLVCLFSQQQLSCGLDSFRCYCCFSFFLSLRCCLRSFCSYFYFRLLFLFNFRVA